jgi:hypothetical protein
VYEERTFSESEGEGRKRERETHLSPVRYALTMQRELSVFGVLLLNAVPPFLLCLILLVLLLLLILLSLFNLLPRSPERRDVRQECS